MAANIPPLPPERVPGPYEMGRLTQHGDLQAGWACRWCGTKLAWVRLFLRCPTCDPEPYLLRPSPGAAT